MLEATVDLQTPQSLSRNFRAEVLAEATPLTMNPKDRIRLQHMLDSAEKTIAFSRGKSRLDLDTDELLSLALVRPIEIMGEAVHGSRLQARETV